MAMRFSIVVSTRAPREYACDWLWPEASGAAETIVIGNAGRCGLGQAYNEGLLQASGEFCCFLHDDVRVETAGWLERLADAVERRDYDLVGVAGTTRLPTNGAWWEGGDGTGRGTVLHRTQSGELLRSDFGPPDIPKLQLSTVVSLDGLLLFGRRKDFLAEPFDVEQFDGFHFYDSDLCLRWLLWGGRRLAVAHDLVVIHDQGASLEGWQPFLERFHRRHGGFLPLDLSSAETWQKNLRILEARDPQTASVVTAPRRPGKYFCFAQLADGTVQARRGTEVAVVKDPETAPNTPSVGVLVFQGAGTGQTICRALDDPQTVVQVVEPEGHLVAWLLSRFDWHKPMFERRLRWSIPALEVPALAEVSFQDEVARAQQLGRESGGQSSWMRTGSTDLHTDFFRDLEAAAAVAEEVAGRVRCWPTGADFAFDVTVVSPNCAIFDDLAECFRRLGLATRLLRVPDRPADWTRIGRLHALRHLIEAPSRVVLLRNRCLVETTNPKERFDALRLIPARVVSWWWDLPNVSSYIDQAAQQPQPPALALAHGMLRWLPPGSRWLPAGARLPFCQDPAGAEEPLPMTFVGQSRFALLQSNLEILANALVAYVGNIGRRLAERLNRAPDLPTLYAVLREHEPELRRAIDVSCQAGGHAYYLDYLLAMSLAAAFRLAAVATLVRFPLLVFGDSGWVDAGIVPRERFRGLLPPDQLPALYRRSRLNLNFNFMQVSTAVNPKVLDVAAAGGAVLTDPRPELEELFPDPAVRPFVFESLDQLADRVSDLLRQNHDDRCAPLKSHVRGRHTLLHRADALAKDWALPTRD